MPYILLAMSAELQQALLNLSVQGVFLFGADLRIRDQVSQAAAKLFEADIRGQEAAALLFADPSAAAEFREGVKLVFSGQTLPGVVFDLLEKEIERNGRRLRLDYAWLSEGLILVTATDITRERRFQDIAKRDLERRFAVLKAVSHRRYFAMFNSEARALFDSLSRHEDATGSAAELSALARELHTFKGNAGFFDFPNTVAAAHRLESHLEELRVLGGPRLIKEGSLDLKKAYFAELNLITDILGPRWLGEADSICIGRQAYHLVESWVREQHPEDRRLANTLRSFRRVPFRELFVRFPEMVQGLAARLGKRLHPLVVEGGDFLVVPERYEKLMAVLVHLIRNALDHGIEPASERQAAGKAPVGSLRLKLDRAAGRLSIVIGDDGRGIDPEQIRQRAGALGMARTGPLESEADLMQLLFFQGFSTAASTSELSGRGIGLAAVQTEVQRLGGTIEVHSRKGRGTTFEITLPEKGQRTGRKRSPRPAITGAS